MRALARLLANAETRVIYRQESDQLGATAQALGLTGTEQGLLPGLGTGQGLWRIKNRSFVVQHQLHPAELAMYETGQKARGESDGFPPKSVRKSREPECSNPTRNQMRVRVVETRRRSWVPALRRSSWARSATDPSSRA